MPEASQHAIPPIQSRLARIALLLVAGTLQTLTFSPFDAWPLGPLSMALLCWIAWYLPAGALFRTGWWFGIGLFGTGASWVFVSINTYGSTSLPLSLVLTGLFVAGLSLFPALTFWGWGKLAGPDSIRRLWLLPGVWVIGDWLRGHLLTGFPWLYLGTSQVSGPLAGWAPIAGVHAVTLIEVATGALLFAAYRAYRLQQRKLSSGIVGTILVVWLISPLLSRIQWTKPESQPVSFVAAQGDVPQLMKWDPKFLSRQIKDYFHLTEGHWNKDLILWPETAIPLPQDDAGPIIDDIRQLLGPNTTLVTGIPWHTYSDTGHDIYHNSIMAMGNGSGVYHKQKLVPFGEYVPLEHWLRGLIAFFDLPMSEFTKGPAHQDPLKVGAHKVMPFICYEIAYPDFVAHNAEHTNYLINISNDAWFGHSLGPLQHLQIVRMRALETQRYILRDTNNGITALVGPDGQIEERAPRFVQTIMTGKLYPVTGLTPFMRWGSWPALIICLALIVLARARKLGPETG